MLHKSGLHGGKITAGQKARENTMTTTLEQLNAANEVSSWAWMSGYLRGLANEGYYFSLSNIRKSGDRWNGQFTCGNDVEHDFVVFCGDPERDAILASSTHEKVYQLKMRDEALQVLPPWDVYQFIEVA